MSEPFVRPSWDKYFMDIAAAVSTRSNCCSRQVGAVIVRDRRILSTGYNGTPRGTKNCSDGGCARCWAKIHGEIVSGAKLEDCTCSHGEENAIVQASYHGTSINGGTMYTIFCPCLMCAKMSINAGILRIVYNADYPLNDLAQQLLREAGVSLEKISL